MPKKCLIIDDVEVTRFTTSQFLQELGLASDVTESTSNALDMIKNSRYDAVFLDWHIGRESGIEFLKKVRSMLANVPVFVVSGVEGAGSAPQALEAGAQGFIEKPTTKQNLETFLRREGIL